MNKTGERFFFKFKTSKLMSAIPIFTEWTLPEINWWALSRNGNQLFKLSLMLKLKMVSSSEFSLLPSLRRESLKWEQPVMLLLLKLSKSEEKWWKLWLTKLQSTPSNNSPLNSSIEELRRESQKNAIKFSLFKMYILPRWKWSNSLSLM